MELESIELDRLVPTPENPRIIREDDAGLNELADSIRALGVLEPVLARPAGDGKYDLRCGARRVRAATLAGLTEIPCIVREMTDEQAFEITITENLQREDVHPLEEATGIQMMLDRGWTLEQAANQLGKSTKWVARRAQLTKLTEHWRDMIADPSSDVSHWSASHLELIARFPAPLQAEIADRYDDDWGNFAGLSLAELRRELTEYLHLLAGAPWGPHDSLLPDVGPCDECPKRSDRQQELFDLEDFDEGRLGQKPKPGARCLDAACWRMKQTAYVQAKEAELRAEHGDVVLVRDGYSAVEEGTPWEGKISGSLAHLEHSKHGTKGAKPHLVVAGPQAGQVVWAQPGGRGGSSATGSKPDGPTPLSERRKRLQQMRGKLVTEALLARLQDIVDAEVINTSNVDDAQIATLVLTFGTAERYAKPYNYCQADWDRYDENSKENPEALLDYLFVSVIRVLISRLNSTLEGSEELPSKEVAQVCRVMGYDYEALWTEACAKKPEPKAWAKLNEDGTPKVAKKKAAKKAAKGKAKAKSMKKEKKAAAQTDSEAPTGPNRATGYVDDKGRVLFVDDGISDGTGWATYYRKENGSLKRLVSKQLPIRESRAQAETDLAEYARAKGFESTDATDPTDPTDPIHDGAGGESDIDKRVGTPFEGDPRVNVHGVFFAASIEALAFEDAANKFSLEIDIVDARPFENDWRAGYSYQFGVTEVGAHGQDVSASIQSDSYSTRGAAIAGTLDRIKHLVTLSRLDDKRKARALQRLEAWREEILGDEQTGL